MVLRKYKAFSPPYKIEDKEGLEAFLKPPTTLVLQLRNI